MGTRTEGEEGARGPRERKEKKKGGGRGPSCTSLSHTHIRDRTPRPARGITRSPPPAAAACVLAGGASWNHPATAEVIDDTELMELGGKGVVVIGDDDGHATRVSRRRRLSRALDGYISSWGRRVRRGRILRGPSAAIIFSRQARRGGDRGDGRRARRRRGRAHAARGAARQAPPPPRQVEAARTRTTTRAERGVARRSRRTGGSPDGRGGAW